MGGHFLIMGCVKKYPEALGMEYVHDPIGYAGSERFGS
jgi:hypothetical protein